MPHLLGTSTERPWSHSVLTTEITFPTPQRTIKYPPSQWVWAGSPSMATSLLVALGHLLLPSMFPHVHGEGANKNQKEECSE